jgi:hypothetical protein
MVWTFAARIFTSFHFSLSKWVHYGHTYVCMYIGMNGWKIGLIVNVMTVAIFDLQFLHLGWDRQRSGFRKFATRLICRKFHMNSDMKICTWVGSVVPRSLPTFSFTFSFPTFGSYNAGAVKKVTSPCVHFKMCAF